MTQATRRSGARDFAASATQPIVVGDVAAAAIRIRAALRP